MLRVERLSKRLGQFVISDISFDVGEGEYFVLLGASGAGKTILLETIAGIHRLDAGRITLGGRDITRESIQGRNVGLVFQDRVLFPHLSVRRNIAYGPRSRGIGRSEAEELVLRTARNLEIEHLLDRSPGTLSGGEAQRVSLARALAIGPPCLLLDEPLSSLDIGARADMRALLRRLNRNGITMLHVTHDYEEAVSLATRIGVMEHGTIVQAGPPDEIFRRPASEFVARFVGIRNFFAGRLVRRDGKVDENRPSAAGDPALPDPSEAEFVSSGLTLNILTDAPEADGHAIIRSEDVTVSREPFSTSARNLFEGTVTDAFPCRLGMEVIIDIGPEIAALVTKGSVEELGLRHGAKVYVGIKASAVRFIEA
jgi:molybdate transport system ATP-binding protein